MRTGTAASLAPTTPLWRAPLALMGALGMALGSAGDNAFLVALSGVALAAAGLMHLAAWRQSEKVARRERERMANIDRQIVDVVRRHADMLERRRAALQGACDRIEMRGAWDRDIAHFHSEYVHDQIASLKRSESDDEILARVQLAADEVLSLRARVSRSAA
ncbi:MAG: hypothetical protein JNJ73_10385 [Hyphomonadaceae bacterium]|nr:hypothetical protein [Hyphomonadaceae bacterium]